MDAQELTSHERFRLWGRLGLRLLLAILALLVLLFVVPPLFSLLTPFVLALILAWLLNPVIRAIQRHIRLSRKAISLVLLLLLLGTVGGVLGALVYSIVTELISLANNWQSIWAQAVEFFSALQVWLSGLLEYLPPEVEQAISGALDSLIAWVQDSASAWLNAAASGMGSFAVSVPSFTIGLVAFVMGSYFITSDYPRLREMVKSRLPQSARGFLSQVKRAAVSGFGGYLRAELILAIVVFFILLIGFFLTGQPYAVLLAFLLAVLDFIPIVGSGTVMVPWAVISLFTGEFGAAAELMIIWGVIAIFRQVAEPRIVGGQTGLSPILSLLSIYVGMRLWGVLGMILAPVTCMVVINICRLGIFDGVLADLRLAVRDISALLRNRPALPPEDEGEN